jgi:hypothetical protein
MPPSQSARSQGAAIRQARRARVRGIRRRVVASALALFVATWMLITLMLVTGHDPALARNTAKTVAASTPATTTVTTGASGTAATTSTPSTGTTASSTGSTQSSGTSSLTSSQS